MYNHDSTTEKTSHRQADLRQAELEMFELQSNKDILTRKHTDLISDIRRMKTDITHLKQTLEEKMTEEHSLAREIELAEEALARAKKHRNTL
ncbi:MAG TPA: hypothetical protein VJH89_03140 [Patescibacteria group bacterium]|nr:hypothetical protein [Patescibacteria group bacterium]